LHWITGVLDAPVGHVAIACFSQINFTVSVLLLQMIHHEAISKHDFQLSPELASMTPYNGKHIDSRLDKIPASRALHREVFRLDTTKLRRNRGS
jgi:hypothetical protein